LKGAKSIGAQLSRVAASELRKATDELADPPLRAESIHEARKHVKKARSVLHLLRKALGDDYARFNGPMRSAAHRMSAVRDAEALLGTMKMLRRRYRGVIPVPAARRVEAVFRTRLRRSCAALAGRRLAMVSQTLAHSRRSLRSTLRHAASAGTMRDGMERGYRRARRAMGEATAAAEDLRFHTWRRRIKDHWYQLRLVEGMGTEVRARVHDRVRQLKRLQDWLGDEHNLTALRAAILEQPHRFGDARTVALILGCIDERQALLRRRALRRGRRLFSRKPSAFRKQVRGWWP
jgi:CHAD domain-containing protein